MQLSRRTQQKYADLCAKHGTVRAIGDLYDAHGFSLPATFEPTPGSMRRSVCEAAEATADLADADVQRRLVRVYLDGVDEFGRRPTGGFLPADDSEDEFWPEARSLIRSLQRDGAPVDDEGRLMLGGAPPVLPVERFHRLDEPKALLEHLDLSPRASPLTRRPPSVPPKISPRAH